MSKRTEMKQFNPLCFLVILALGLIFQACQKGKDTREAQFNIDQFEENIVNGLTGQVPGFAYAINQDQFLYVKGAEGFADVAAQIPITPTMRMHIASVSKTLTAAAVLKILDKTPGVDVDSPVLPYLPNHWTPGPNIPNLTFRNLLTHKSGFLVGGGGGEYNDLKVLIEGGLDEVDRGDTLKYYNDNYSLFRIILPILAGKQDKTVTDLDALALAWAYMEIIHEELLDPMGIDQAYCKQLSNVPLKYYSCMNSGSTTGGDWTLRSGAYGWNLSAFDLAAFMAYLRYDNSIFSSALRTIMDDGYLGWENEKSSANGEHGTYLFHSGQWHFGGSTAPGLRTCIMKFADTKVEVSLLINCVDHPDPDIASPRKFLRKAFDAAWE